MRLTPAPSLGPVSGCFSLVALIWSMLDTTDRLTWPTVYLWAIWRAHLVVLVASTTVKLQVLSTSFQCSFSSLLGYKKQCDSSSSSRDSLIRLPNPGLQLWVCPAVSGVSGDKCSRDGTNSGFQHIQGCPPSSPCAWPLYCHPKTCC